MQGHKMRKIDKIIYDLSAEEHKSLMEKLKRDKSGE
jgi:hypothetical protein